MREENSQNANINGIGNALSLYKFASPSVSVTNARQLKNNLKHLQWDFG
jgi:hypothetical protein